MKKYRVVLRNETLDRAIGLNPSATAIILEARSEKQLFNKIVEVAKNLFAEDDLKDVAYAYIEVPTF